MLPVGHVIQFPVRGRLDTSAKSFDNWGTDDSKKLPLRRNSCKLDDIRFFVKLNYHGSTITLSVGIKYSMINSICNPQRCVMGHKVFFNKGSR